MDSSSLRRTISIASLLPEHSGTLLDVGCGPLTPAYPYLNRATQLTCIDWRLSVFGVLPEKIETVQGNFTQLALPLEFYDTVIAADVFEHIALEEEQNFIGKCISVLKPGGHLVISVPHLGTFSWLDPYSVKPDLQWIAWRIGMRQNTYNGSCDIRKGHKHYIAEELVEIFRPLRLERTLYWGYFFDPLSSWLRILTQDKLNFPGATWLERRCEKEFERHWGRRAFNIAMRFVKI